MVPQKSSWSSLRSAEEMSRSETETRNTDQSIAYLEREVEVDTDTIGEQLSDLNAFFGFSFSQTKATSVLSVSRPAQKKLQRFLLVKRTTK